jgi:hypothetical protein
LEAAVVDVAAVDELEFPFELVELAGAELSDDLDESPADFVSELPLAAAGFAEE